MPELQRAIARTIDRSSQGAGGQNGRQPRAGFHLNSEAKKYCESDQQLNALFHEGLKDIYFAEKTMLTALHALLAQLAEKAINREAQIAYAIETCWRQLVQVKCLYPD